ncbi:MAG: type I methionyl aminopeptidase [Bacteroidia bacterium]|nr:type I methionyl aminopeptidase [Bacteroidia bacterium]MCC6768475.1 type I methionyl aminopeptidase [Bacteroidia bacterium]
MIYYKTNEEIELIRESSLLVARTLAEVAKSIQPGVTSLQLDKIAEEFIRDNGGIPAFKGLNGFPNTLCMSPNEQVVHGIPDNRPYESGDIISVDCGVKMNGFFGDSAYTFTVGEVSEEVKRLLKVTKESLYRGISMAIAGKRLQDISYEVQSYCENHGYSVVRELVGHGIGRNLHEAPEVPNFGKRGSGLKLQEGLVIAIEPMINLGKRQIVHGKDGWTVKTADGKPSAHFEHTIAVRKDKADILSSFLYVEEVLKERNLTIV